MYTDHEIVRNSVDGSFLEMKFGGDDDYDNYIGVGTSLRIHVS